MLRRQFHLWGLGGALGVAAPAAHAMADSAGDAAPPPPTRLALAWRGPREGDPHHVGQVRVDWASGRIAVLQATPLPGRPHGLLRLPDGGLVVVAARPGAWLMRLGPDGRVEQQLALDDEADAQRLGGHALASADGAWLFTSQTDPRSGLGWLAVRDARSLRTQARWALDGVDPHQVLLHPQGGDLLVAMGGIARDTAGRKRDQDRMRSSLIRLRLRDGAPLGAWTLDDPRLSLRHLAWSSVPPHVDPPALGVALQAEHDDPQRRAEAPVLALWDGHTLRTAPPVPGAAGYAGDIAPAPGGGYLLSAQRAGRVLHWDAHTQAWSLAGALTEACALGALPSADGAVVMLGARGAGRWHPGQPARLAAWPQPMAADNHCIVIDDATA